MAALCTSTWGDPTATKHVLLIHGVMGSSQMWYHIAVEFASRGYFVTAPDLLGHGNARHGSSDYTMAAIAKELEPLLVTSDHSFDIVVGFSLGGVIAAALLPLLKSTKSVHVVLIDPPFEQTPELVARYRPRFVDTVTNPRTPEAYLKASPSWTKDNAIFYSLGAHLCDVAAVKAILDQNVSRSFTHYLGSAPDNVKVTVLMADPTKEHGGRVEDMQPYPHVTAKTIWGASHLILFEFPMVVVETALEGAGVLK